MTLPVFTVERAKASELAQVVDRMSLMGCTLRRAATQTLNDAVVTPFSWDTQDVDTDNLWTPGAPTIITLPETGQWAITAEVNLTAAATGRTFIEVLLGSQPSGPYYRATIGANSEDTGVVTIDRPLAAGETVVINVYRDAASGTTMTGQVTCYRQTGGAT